MVNFEEEELNTKIKAELLQILTRTVYFKDEKSTLMVALQKTASSLQQCYTGKRKKINYPQLFCLNIFKILFFDSFSFF